MEIDIDELRLEVEQGFVSKQTSKIDPYFIYNYTPSAQWSQHWTIATMQCRGLILDGEGNIIARPFPKFFNYGENPTPPRAFQKPTMVQDKADGSLAVVYRGSDGYRVATRGSFHSDQAEWATKWLNKTYPNFEQPEGVTTLAEIIYPDNRIVIDYGSEEKLVLLTAIDNATGADIPLEEITWWQGPVCDQLAATDIEHAYHIATSGEFDNAEGIVCTWFNPGSPSLRLKVKHPEYVRLHRIITNFSEKRLWEALANGDDYIALIDRVPDEFYQEVSDLIDNYTTRYQDIEIDIEKVFNEIKHLPRKEFAGKAKAYSFASSLFAKLDGKPYSQYIWKQLKPGNGE